MFVRKLQKKIHGLIVDVTFSLVGDPNQDGRVVRIQNGVKVGRAWPDKSDMELDAIDCKILIVELVSRGFILEGFEVKKTSQSAHGRYSDQRQDKDQKRPLSPFAGQA